MNENDRFRAVYKDGPKRIWSRRNGMTTGQTSRVFRHLYQIALLRDGGGMSDGQLLDSFLARRDDAAFAALVKRHGRMVFAVCRRILRNQDDAEDAFQATFLVLVR